MKVLSKMYFKITLFHVIIFKMIGRKRICPL